MANDTALLQAASGLEKLMAGSRTSGPIRDSSVAQISALLYYQANVLAKLESNASFQNLFKTTIFQQIEKDFGLYLDAKARSNPKSLHHVYEWNKVGNSSSRLFKLFHVDKPGLSFNIQYNFLDSKTFVPTKNPKSKKKYKFTNKATVMESGMPVVIYPKSAQRIVFEMNGIPVFMPKGAPVRIKSPGGTAASHKFQLSYAQFFSGNLVNDSIKKSGFQQIFNSNMAKALKIPASIKRVRYSFSPNAVRIEADAALARSFGGVL